MGMPRTSFRLCAAAPQTVCDLHHAVGVLQFQKGPAIVKRQKRRTREGTHPSSVVQLCRADQVVAVFKSSVLSLLSLNSVMNSSLVSKSSLRRFKSWMSVFPGSGPNIWAKNLPRIPAGGL